MSRLSIDFVPSRRVPPGLRWLAAGAAVACGLASTHAWLDYREAYAAWELKVAEQTGEPQANQQTPRDSGQDDDTAAQLRQLRAMHARLDAAWIPLFDMMESIYRDDIAMLGFNADAGAGALSIEAEARDPQAMQDYLAALGTKGYLSRVHLVSQVRGAQLSGTGVRFSVQANWPVQPRVTTILGGPGSSQ